MGVSGIWIHGCIDGYSRFLVYLEARLDKQSETVRRIFRAWSNKVGWSSRTRGDRGKVLLCHSALMSIQILIMTVEHALWSGKHGCLS